MGKLPNDPTYIPIPFAESGNRNVLPENPASAYSNLASWNYGFPEITRKDKSDGGLPPAGKDFQGIFYSLSEHTYYQQSGGIYKWNSALNYPIGAIVLGSNGTWYRALKQSGPNIAGVGVKNPTTAGNSGYITNETSASIYWQNIDLVYATSSRTGVVKVGTNIDVASGVISVKTANGTTLGLAKQGTNVTVSNGAISVATANGSTLGLVKQGNYLTINDGTISANKANGATPGVVYQGDYVTITEGKLSVNKANGSIHGVVYQGDYVTITGGRISVNKATGSSLGAVCQGNYVTITNGIISANTANGTIPGVVSQGTNVVISDKGVISVATGTTSVKGVVQLSTSTSSGATDLAATPSAVKAVNDACVHKAGDTMTGDLAISKTNPYFRLKSTNITKATKPSANYTPVAVEHVDSANKRLWGIYYNYNTDKTSYVRLIVNKGTTTDNTWAGIGVGYDGSGNWFTYAPTPAAADSSTKIATTEWVRNASGNTKLNAATATKATNDSDGKKISTTYAKLASPALTGTPTAPTAKAGTNNTQIATTAWVNANQLSKRVTRKATRSSTDGDWTITGLTANVPLYIIHTGQGKGSDTGKACQIRIKSGGTYNTNNNGGFWVGRETDNDLGKSNTMFVIPTGTSVTLTVSYAKDDGDGLAAYQ